MRTFVSIAALSGLAALTSAIPLLEERTPARLDAASLIKRVVTPDDTCGYINDGNNNGYKCITGQCCSSWGWCGTTSEHCGSGCQPGFGKCGVSQPTTKPATTSSTTTTAAPPAATGIVSPSGRCGLVLAGNGKGYICPTGECCSQYGWCGTGRSYCKSGCQPGFGKCDGVVVTTSSKTASSSTAVVVSSSSSSTAAASSSIPAASSSATVTSEVQSSSNSPVSTPPSSTPSSSEAVSSASASSIPSSSSVTETPSSSVATSSAASSSSTLEPVPTFGPRPKFGTVEYGVGISNCRNPGYIGLTFNAQPWIYTNDILDLLVAYGYRATFFLNGEIQGGKLSDETLPWAMMVRRMIAEGHQVALHSYTPNADFNTLSYSKIINEILTLENSIRNIIGRYPTYMRPSVGSCEGECLEAMNNLGYHVIYSDFDPKDDIYNTPETQQKSKDIVNAVLSASNPAADSYILELQGNEEQTAHNLTAHALEYFVRYGYIGTTVGECFNDPEANWYRSTP